MAAPSSGGVSVKKTGNVDDEILQTLGGIYKSVD